MSLCRQTCYIGAVCLFFYFLNIDKKNICDSRRPYILSISLVAISVGLMVVVDNPVPTNQVGYQ